MCCFFILTCKQLPWETAEMGLKQNTNTKNIPATDVEKKSWSLARVEARFPFHNLWPNQ